MNTSSRSERWLRISRIISVLAACVNNGQHPKMLFDASEWSLPNLIDEEGVQEPLSHGLSTTTFTGQTGQGIFLGLPPLLHATPERRRRSQVCVWEWLNSQVETSRQVEREESWGCKASRCDISRLALAIFWVSIPLGTRRKIDGSLYTRAQDTLDPDDPIFPRAATRVGLRYQAIVPSWEEQQAAEARHGFGETEAGPSRHIGGE